MQKGGVVSYINQLVSLAFALKCIIYECIWDGEKQLLSGQIQKCGKTHQEMLFPRTRPKAQMKQLNSTDAERAEPHKNYTIFHVLNFFIRLAEILC